MLARTIFGEEHNLYRQAAREFFANEVAPFHEEWEKDGVVPRELWEKAGAWGTCATPYLRSSAAPASPISASRRS